MLPRVAYVTHAGASDPDLDVTAVALQRAGMDCLPVIWDSAQQWSQFDLALVRTSGSGRPRQEFLRWAREVEQQTQLANPAVILARNTDKSYLRDLARQGVRTVERLWFEPGDSPEALQQDLIARGWTACSIEPNVSNPDAPEVTADSPEQASRVVSQLAARGCLAVIRARKPVDRTVSAVLIGDEISHVVDRHPGGGRLLEPDQPLREFVDSVVATAAYGESLLFARADLELHDQQWELASLEATGPELAFDLCPAAADELAWGVKQLITRDVRVSGPGAQSG
jgi:hypothetical protein